MDGYVGLPTMNKKSGLLVAEKKNYTCDGQSGSGYEGKHVSQSGLLVRRRVCRFKKKRLMVTMVPVFSYTSRGVDNFYGDSWWINRRLLGWLC